MDKVFEAIGIGFITMIIVAGLALLLAFPVLWLWNWLMPVIFGLPVITFWQALGLNLLSGMFFRSHTTCKSKS